MSATVQINSSAQWDQIVAASSVVIADFYADWCGPCKMIAPTFESLSVKYSKPKKITFCKVNVDNQPGVAQKYGVRAMPTFLVLHRGSVLETVQGANPPALTTAVEKAVKLVGSAGGGDAGGGGGGGIAFSNRGHRLGGSGVGGLPNRAPLSRPITWSLGRWLDAIVVFFGLYFASLVTLDPYRSAEKSQFNIHNMRRTAHTGTGSAASGPGQKKPGSARPVVRTLADI